MTAIRFSRWSIQGGAELEAKIEVDVPFDIINDKERLKAAENGLVQRLSDGLYHLGVSFKVDKVHFKIK